MDDTQKGAKLLKIMQAFIEKQKISCAETVYQSDRVIENAYELIQDICDVVGYYKYDDEE